MPRTSSLFRSLAVGVPALRELGPRPAVGRREIQPGFYHGVAPPDAAQVFAA